MADLFWTLLSLAFGLFGAASARLWLLGRLRRARGLV